MTNDKYWPRTSIPRLFFMEMPSIIAIFAFGWHNVKLLVFRSKIELKFSCLYYFETLLQGQHVSNVPSPPAFCYLSGT